MKKLNNECLLETYYKAVELHLESAFIRLLCREIKRRNLQIKKHDVSDLSA
ncbi:sporulation histidine kinase inhibitor Sda [Longirhabdus pacifica]|uniref:sporulation histidine kinase inhibitor Sda n=1 Tax=Longirhabdus pacifica TaxID=2305227 RepID=UPI0010087FA7|nr:sporulation histidine kinase inhibitor Sda [Longirhabdus pacifica]